jgi:hypothetical protein
MATQASHHSLYRICAMLISGAFAVPLLAGGTSNPWDQTDWKHWSEKDVHTILSKSPWVSNCCLQPFMTMGGENGPGVGPSDSGFTARIMSSQTVREALVRKMQLDKRYEKLDPTRRQEVDQQIASCLNENFDNNIVFSFSFAFWDGQDNGLKLASPDQLHLFTFDRREIVGHLLPDSNYIEAKCSWLPYKMKSPGRGEFGNEIAFPRFVNGKPTIGPKTKTIRITVDFHKGYDSYKGPQEFVFNIEKLINQGKPNF